MRLVVKVYCCCLSSDASLVVSGGADMIIRLWDVTFGCVLRMFEGHFSYVSCTILSSVTVIHHVIGEHCCLCT